MKWLDRIVGLGQKKTVLVNEALPNMEPGSKVARWSGLGKIPLTRKQCSDFITTSEEQYCKVSNRESFVDLLQVKSVMDDEILFRDGKTTGAVFEVIPVEADGRTKDFMDSLHNKIMAVLRDAIRRDLNSPWIVQITMQDDSNVEKFIQKIENYGDKEAGNQAFRKAWMKIMREHLEDVSDPSGVFVDEMVSGANWFVRYRKVRIYLWRKDPDIKNDHAQTLQNVVDQMLSRFKAAGMKLNRLDSEELFKWFSHFFLPTGSDIFGKDFEQYLDENQYLKKPDFDDLRAFEEGNTDLSESSLHGTRPSSDEAGNWACTGKLKRFITVQELTQVPKIGHISAELKNGNKRIALWDGMPIGSVWSQILVFTADDEIDEELSKFEGSVLGKDEKTDFLRKKIKKIRQRIAEGDVAIKSLMGVYVTADDAKDLKYKAQNVITALDSAGLKTVPVEYDLIAQDTFIRALPFNYNYVFDKQPAVRRARKVYISQAAKVVPFYGRSRGTENPGFVFFNRGGEPFSFDPLEDRVKNAFSLILGPTGSGKSALLNYIIAQYVALYNARFFIIEKGKSFYLLGEFLRSHGVTVNQIVVTPSSDISLNPFSTACDLKEVNDDLMSMSAEEKELFEKKHDLILQSEEMNDQIMPEVGEDSQRDELGEMTLAAITMITGGEEKELGFLRRHERFHVMTAIVNAGKNTYGRGYTLTEDVADAFNEMSKDHVNYSEAHRARLKEFSDNLRLFCMGVRGQFFNRKGDPWPEADVTIFDIGMMVSDQYSDMLGVSMVSMLNKVISIAEATQYDNRPIITLADEGHITTTNPLIAPIVTNMTKMARKLGLWFWLATQNLSDFKDSSRKMLSNMEWWITMSTTQDEVDQIRRFKLLNDDQISILLTARKAPGKYTEGVVMSDAIPASLFRNVPPAVVMALAQTEGTEKSARKVLMDKHGISELEAAYMIGEAMTAGRKGHKHVV